MRNEDLVDKAWESMLVTLDKKLPQKEKKRRAIIWFWFGGIAVIALALLYLPTKKIRPTANNINMPISKDKTILSSSQKSTNNGDSYSISDSIHLKMDQKQSAPSIIMDADKTLTKANYKKSESTKSKNIENRIYFNASVLNQNKESSIVKYSLKTIKPESGFSVPSKKNKFLVGAGIVYAPKQSLTGVEMGSSYLINPATRFVHGPSISFLALGINEAQSNQKQESEPEVIDVSINEGADMQEDEEITNTTFSNDILNGTLYQLNASYSLHYSLVEKLRVGLKIGYAYALNSYKQKEYIVSNSSIVQEPKLLEQRWRSFVRPSVAYSVNGKLNLKIAYQIHQSNLFVQGEDFRRYNYLHIGLCYQFQ